MTSNYLVKAYTDLKVLKTGDTMTGNFYFDGSIQNLSVGCNNLGAENYFQIYLGSEAINITTDNSNFNLFAPRIITISAESDLNIIVIDYEEIITFRKPLYMTNHRIPDLDTPVAAIDAVNKQHVDSKFDALNERLQRLESRIYIVSENISL